MHSPRYLSTLRMSLMLLIGSAAQCVHAQEFSIQFPVTGPPFALGRVMPAVGGGLLVHYGSAPADMFIRYDADGEAQWARQYYLTPGGINSPGIEVAGYTPMPDGGVVISGSVDYYLGDTARYSHVRLGPEGEVLWGQRYFISGWPVPIIQAQLTGAAILANDAEGNVFTALEHGWEAVSGPTILKCDDAGTLQWAVDLKQVSVMAPRPLVLADEQGGCYVAILQNSFQEAGFTLYSLRTDGSLNWRRKLVMNGGQSWLSVGLAKGSGGTVLVAGWMNNDAYLLRIDQDGTLDQAWSYPVGPQQFPAYARLNSLPMPDGGVRFGETDVLRFLADGTLAEMLRCPRVSYEAGGEEYELSSHINGGDVYGVVVEGYMRAINTATSGIRMGLTAARVPWSALGDGCPFNCSNMPTAQAVPLSDSVYTYFNEPYDGPFPLFTYTTGIEVLDVEHSMPETTDLCLTLGVTQQEQPNLGLRPNPLVAGDLLQVDVRTPRSWQCMDAMGRVVPIDAQRNALGLLVPTANLAPGLYSILVSVEGYALPAVARFVVQ